MRRTGQFLAIAGAVLGLSLPALPATAATVASTGADQTQAAAAGHSQAGHPAPTPAQLRALAQAERIRALIDQRGAITGLVRGVNGAPQANVCVTASGPTGTRIGFSRPDGRFLISGLRLGAYLIEYRGCSPFGRFTGQWYGGLTRSSATRVLVTPGRPVQLAPVTLSKISPRFEPRPAAALRLADPGIRLLMLIDQARSGAANAVPSARSARISGGVTSRAGRPLRGICVFADTLSGIFGPSFFTRTTKSGGYTLGIPLPGRYRIVFLPTCASSGNFAPQLWKGAGSVARATILRIGPHQVIRHIDAVLGVGASISGRVHSGPHVHNSFAGICVFAQGLGGQRLFYGLAITRADGTFRLPDLATGKYQLQFFSGCSRQPSSYLPVTLRKPIAVTDGKTTTGINVYLQLGGTITGTVKDSGGHPLSGICAAAVSASGFGLEMPTGPDGSYQIPGLATGQYQMQFNTGCGNNGPYAQVTLPNLVHVTAGKTTAGVNAVMPLTGTIAGVVKNSGGNPLPGICVIAVGVNNPGLDFVSTSANGTYQAKDLPPGTYQVQFLPGGVFASCGSTGNYLPVALSATVSSGTTTSLNAVLPTGGVISGVARDSRGHPLAGICIISSSPYGNQAVTARDGSYQLTQLFSGSYDVGFEGGCGNSESIAPVAYRDDPTFLAPDAVPVTAGQTTPGIDVTMLPGGTVTGHVTDQSGRPLSNICVFVSSVTGAGGNGGFGNQVITVNGAYQAANLPPGQYSVFFGGVFTANNGCVVSGRYADQDFHARGSGATPDSVSVAGGVITGGVNAALAPAGSISGYVLSRAGQPVPGGCVNAIDPRTQAAGSAQAGLNGRYVLTDIPAGRYRVEFVNCGPVFGPGTGSNYASQWYRDRTSEASATPVIVRAGQTTRRINSTLTAGGTIEGQVVFGPHNRPVSFVCVFAFAAGSSTVGTGVTDRRGDYAITGLNTDRYQVEFDPCSPGNALAGQIRAGQVHVVAGQTVRGINARVQVGGSVSGMVTASPTVHGPLVPAVGACVEVLPTTATALGSATISVAGGNYQATNLAPGKYVVYFGDPFCSSDSPALAPQFFPSLVTVAAQQTTTGINTILQPDGGISGVVRGVGNRPVAGICAEVVPVSGGAGRIIGISASGGYHVIDLVPGGYKVRFESGCGANGYATRWYKNARTGRQATVVQVSAGTVSTGISITLPRG